MLPRVNLIRADSADFLLFATDDAVSRTIYSTGAWAAPLLTISQMFYRNMDAPLIIDIGANLGAYAIPIAKDIAAVSGQVYAYEPQRIIYYQLCGNAFLNRLDNLFAFNIAIGDHDGEIQIPSIDYAASKNIGGFSLDEHAHDQAYHITTNANQASSPVKIARIDSLQLPNSPALIKIDVEGLELQVLKGAVNYLEQNNFPPILLEAWDAEWFKDRKNELLNFLTTLGYSFFIIQSEIIAQHPKFPRQIKFNIDANSTIQMIRTS